MILFTNYFVLFILFINKRFLYAFPVKRIPFGGQINKYDRKGRLSTSSYLAESKKSDLVPSSPNPSSWNEKLMKVANIASILCVIDCTVLPIFLVLLSVMGVGSSPSTHCCGHNHGLLNTIGHSIANFIVVPIGTLVTIVNFFNKKILSGFLSFAGLVLIYATNSEGGLIMNRFKNLDRLFHILHDNAFWHRTVNLTGVACLLSANYLSNRKGDKCCDHDH